MELSSLFKKAKEWFTWGKIAFSAVLATATFGTFVAGEIRGANMLEPRVTALEARVEKIETHLGEQGEQLLKHILVIPDKVQQLETRVAGLEVEMRGSAKDLGEIKGYLKAMADKMGVQREHE
jgi:hypothetical protein